MNTAISLTFHYVNLHQQNNLVILRLVVGPLLIIIRSYIIW